MFVPEQGSYRASSSQPRFLQWSVPGDQSNRAVEADNRPFHLQRLCALPELHYGNTSVNPWNLQKGQWLTSQNLKMLTFYGHTDLVIQTWCINLTLLFVYRVRHMTGFQLLCVNHDGCHMWGRKCSLFQVHMIHNHSLYIHYIIC